MTRSVWTMPSPGDRESRRANASGGEAEQALAESLREASDGLRLIDGIIESLPIGFALLDAQLRFARVNRAAAEMNGLPEAEHVGAELQRLLPFVGPAAAQRYRMVIETGQPLAPEEISGETPAQPGVQRWWIHSAAPVKNPAGEVVAVAVIFTEISETKRIEADLRASERREHFLAEVTARMVSSLDPGEILADLARLAVPALADICTIGLFDDTPATQRLETAGLEDQEQPHVERIHLRRWRRSPDSDEMIDAAMKRGESVFASDFSDAWIAGCAPDQAQAQAARSLRASSLMCVPLVARGETIGMATFAQTRSGRRFSEQDLTLLREVLGRASIAVDNARLYSDLQDTAEGLRRANDAKDEFLGLVSHELKTPITTISGNADVLRRSFRDLDDEMRTQALEDIRTDAERLDRIIDNLLILARLESGPAPEVEPILLRRVIAQIVKKARRAAPGRQIDFAWTGKRTPVNASRDYIEQVLLNLIGNALKYDPNGTIEVRGHTATRAIELRVLDRGPGIDPREAERLFEPFYRSPRTAASARGVGVGLTACKRLIEALGGRVWVLPREGGGSEFGFSLPHAPEPE